MKVIAVSKPMVMAGLRVLRESGLLAVEESSVDELVVRKILDAALRAYRKPRIEYRRKPEVITQNIDIKIVSIFHRKDQK